MLKRINNGKITSWDEVHAFYVDQGNKYQKEKTNHAFACLMELLKLTPAKFNKKILITLLQQSLTTKTWMTKAIYDSRAKDYENPYRKMVYETEKEMEKVVGKLKENGFIRQQEAELIDFEKKLKSVLSIFEK